MKGSETMDDPLYCKALVLDDGTVRMALIANNLIGVDGVWWTACGGWWRGSSGRTTEGTWIGCGGRRR